MPPPTPAGKSVKAGWLRVLPSLLLVPMILFSIGWVVGVGEPASERASGDLCPAAGSRASGDVTFLFDFTKPLAGTSANRPGQLLRDLTLGLERGTEIRAYLLTGSADAPLALLARFCKPFNDSDLQLAQAKDHGGGVRDCDDLPAQLTPEVRDSAARFCAVRNSLQARVDTLAARASLAQGAIPDTHLVEALEETRMELQERPGPHRLHVFSDMMQHAHWYSHLTLDWSHWDYEEFSRLLADHSPVFGQRRQTPNTDIDIHYVRRVGKTTERRARERHQDFWRDYFAGSSVTFHEHSSIAVYPSRSVAELASKSMAATPTP